MATRRWKRRKRLLSIVQGANKRAARLADQCASHRVSPSADLKVQADIDKLRAETRKIYVSMVGPLLAALGMSAVFLCIFFVAHSFTSGVSAGDTLLFASIAMGYVLCSVVISSVGLFFFYPRINRLQLRGSIGMRMKRSAEPVSKRRSSPWPIRLNRPATAPPN